MKSHLELSTLVGALKKEIAEIQDNEELSKDEKMMWLKRTRRKLKKTVDELVEMENHLEWYEW